MNRANGNLIPLQKLAQPVWSRVTEKKRPSVVYDSES